MKLSYRIGISIGIVGLATVLQLALWPMLKLPFILYFPSVIFCALYGHALVGILLAATGAVLIFLQPQFSEAATEVKVFQLTMFVLQGLLIWWITSMKNRAMAIARIDRSLARQQQERFSIIFDRAPLAISLVSTANTKIVAVNNKFTELFEVSQEEVIGSSMTELGLFRSVEHRDKVRSEFLRSGQLRGVELEMKSRSGKHLTIATYSEKIAIDGQDFTLSMVEDVTERRRIANDLKKAVQARDEFLSMASHELKTPITSLDLQVQLMNKKLGLLNGQPLPVEDLQKYLKNSLRQVRSLTTLVNELLDISRIQTGRLTLNLQPTKLNTLVTNAAEMLSEQFKQARSTLGLDLQEVEGQWDAQRIEQVVINLMTNAIRHASGTPTSVVLKKSNDKAVLVVQDGGPGIPPDQHERIFERFQRVGPMSEVAGLGLGLYLAKKIVEAHRGNIRVESETNHGAKFFVELPLQPPTNNHTIESKWGFGETK